MVVRKRGNKWWIDFMFDRTRYRKPCPENSKTGATAYEMLIRQRLARGESLRAKKEIKLISFIEFSKQWMKDYVEVNNKNSEIESKKMILRAHLIPFFGNRALAEITNQNIEQYKAQKLYENKSAKSINNHLAVLRKLLVTAEEWELLNKIPKVKLLKVMSKDADYLTIEDCNKLLASAEGVWKDMILFAINTGLRYGEMVALKWRDVDFKKRMIIVEHSIVKDIPQDSTKSNRIRYVPIIDEVFEMLLNRKIYTRGEYVFYERDGKFLKREFCRNKLNGISKRANLRRIGWHTLRHTFASHLAEKRITPNVIKDLLGHSDIRTTMRYAHLDSSALREAIKVLEKPKADCHKIVTMSQNEENTNFTVDEIIANDKTKTERSLC